MDYLEFELKIGRRAEGGYAVSVLESPAGEASAVLDLAPSDPALHERLRQVEAVRGGEASRSFVPSGLERAAGDPVRAVQELGRDLFAALTREKSLYGCYQASLLQARRQGKGLRLRLRIEAADLAVLPWEYLFDPDLKRDHLCLSRETPVVRHLETALPAEPLALEPPIHILGMVGARHGLDAAREQQQMALAIEHLTEKGIVRLDWVEGGTWRDLGKALRRGPWHVFHFIGHGGFDPATGEGLVLLAAEEGGDDAPRRLPARDLGTLLADHPSLKLAVLNSCEGARASETSLFSSTGAILAGRGIPAVVSMQYEITDRAALEFSRSFYDTLAEGEPVDAAVSEARKAIKMSLGETVEWGTPVLHLRARDGRLFRVDMASALFRGAAAAPPTLAPPAPAAGLLPAEPAGPTPPSSLSPPRTPAAADTRKSLLILLRKVRQFWIDGVLLRALHRSAGMEIGMETLTGAVNSPWQSVLPSPGAAGGEPPPAGRSLGAVFEELGGSLLILGEPGAGKTVTLLGLARHLLRSAEEDPTRPIPVVFNLSSWAAGAPPVADWLVDELAAKYLIPKRVARAWLAESFLLPLLDGLDEVQAARRAACVEAINAFTGEALLTGVAVCSRLKEYLDLPVRLALNGAIRLQPLSREQVFSFLAAAGPRLAALSALLERDSGLLIEARSPLMLSLMAEAYEDLPVEALAAEGQETSGARRKKLMEAYVARMFRRVEAGGGRG